MLVFVPPFISIRRLSHLFGEELFPLLHELVEILLHKLKDHEQLVVLADNLHHEDETMIIIIILFYFVDFLLFLPTNLLELDEVGVRQLLQRLDLAQLHALVP